MSKTTLRFDNIAVNKKVHTSKQLIALNLVNVNQIGVSDKFKHSDKVNILLIISLNRYVLFCLK